MKTFTKIIIATALIFGCGQITSAKTKSNSDCGNTDEFKRFLVNFQEQIIFKGYDTRMINGKLTQGLIIITMSNTGSWSMFQITSPDKICIIDAGDGGALIEQESKTSL
jgi:hypothetical protein